MSRPSTPLSAFASLRTGLGAALCALAAVLMTPPAHAQLRGLGPFAQLRDTAAALPRRLEISRGDARVRLIIDSWTALP